jgi:hypothetical protein
MLTLARCQLEDTAQAMTEVFVIRNQLGHYWGKSKTWVDGSQPRLVQRTPHRDEAVNTLFELSSRDIDLRGEVLAAELSERGEPIIEASQIPLPMEATAEQDAAPGAGDAGAADGAEPASTSDEETVA